MVLIDALARLSFRLKHGPVVRAFSQRVRDLVNLFRADVGGFVRLRDLLLNEIFDVRFHGHALDRGFLFQQLFNLWL